MKHPLDIDLMTMTDHLKQCSLCRRKFYRLMGWPYAPSAPR